MTVTTKGEMARWRDGERGAARLCTIAICSPGSSDSMWKPPLAGAASGAARGTEPSASRSGATCLRG